MNYYIKNGNEEPLYVDGGTRTYPWDLSTSFVDFNADNTVIITFPR